MYGSTMDFADLYHNWAVAKLINSKTPNEGYYQFKGIDFKLNIGTPAAPNAEAYDTPGAGPWGTDYIWVSGNPKNIDKLTFNGLDYSMFPPPGPWITECCGAALAICLITGRSSRRPAAVH